jgi:6-phosphogluconolactonase (cycloisomerase 2 family)
MNVIKHSDGTNTYLKGVPNKKALYGYNKDFDKMIQLDVSNYTIQNDGTLVLKNEGSKEIKEGSLTLSVDESNTIINNSYSFKYDYSEEEQLNLSLSLGKNMIQYLQKDSEGSYLN